MERRNPLGGAPGNTGRREFGAAGDIVVREDPQRLASAPQRLASAKGPRPTLQLKPGQPLAPEALIALKQLREQAKDGLADARALVNRPRGRFPDWRVAVPRAVPLSRQQVETVSQLLSVDAVVRIDEGDLAGAADGIKAIVNAGRALGNEPMLAAQAGRVDAVQRAVATLERLLARGELPAAVLVDLQKLFEDEARHPVALVSLQGSRAAVEMLFEEVRTGRAGVPAPFESPARSLPGIIYTWRCIRENQTLHLTHTTRMVELAKRPAPEQGPALEQYADGVSGQDGGLIKRIYFLPFDENFERNVGGWQSQHHTALNLAVLALASERFGSITGAGPNRLPIWCRLILRQSLMIRTPAGRSNGSRWESGF